MRHSESSVQKVCAKVTKIAGHGSIDVYFAWLLFNGEVQNSLVTQQGATSMAGLEKFGFWCSGSVEIHSIWCEPMEESKSISNANSNLLNFTEWLRLTRKIQAFTCDCRALWLTSGYSLDQQFLWQYAQFYAWCWLNVTKATLESREDDMQLPVKALPPLTCTRHDQVKAESAAKLFSLGVHVLKTGYFNLNILQPTSLFVTAQASKQGDLL